MRQVARRLKQRYSGYELDRLRRNYLDVCLLLGNQAWDYERMRVARNKALAEAKHWYERCQELEGKAGNET